jgi:hypothetical protein
MTLQHTLIAIATVAALAVATLPEAEAQRRCPDGTSVGAHRPCGPQTATAGEGRPVAFETARRSWPSCLIFC